jgi:hypothetical protein
MGLATGAQCCYAFLAGGRLFDTLKQAGTY